MTTTYAQAVSFFYKHAGYSYGQGETREQGRRRCARALARAEQDARSAGLTFSWEDDADGSLGDHHAWCDREGDHGHEILGCVCHGPDGTSLASLWSIIDADRDYQRVVEAELASESLVEWRSILADRISADCA